MGSPGAIVAPSDTATAIAVTRALGSRGIPVTSFDSTSRSLGFISRYTATPVHGLVEQEEEVLNALLKLGRKRKGWVLYPTSDFYISVIARHHDSLSSSLIPTVAQWEATKHFIDKLETFRLATRLGIPVPETSAPADMEEVGRLGDRLDFERKTWLVKVRSRLVPQEMLGPFARAKGITVRSPEELRLVCGIALSTGRSPPLVQEKIPGPPHGLVAFNCVVDRGGRPVAWITRRKLRTSPYEFGIGTMWETTLDPEVARLGSRFATASGVYGISSTEFKEDRRDNGLKLIECNCRAAFSSETWRRSGVDLIHILHSLATGSNYDPPTHRRIGLRWTSLVDDLTELLTDRRQYPLTPSLPWRVAKQYLGTRCWAFLSASDPLPFMIYALRRFRKRKLRDNPSVGR
ncbi:MAG: hypothetical protein ACE5KH_00810 [Candidatus Geothermarchaeales archaeon]